MEGQFPGKEELPDFKELLLNSNREATLQRKAADNGDLSKARDYESFLKSLNESTRKENLPKNNLDKNDFLTLFVTQLQQQDPLKPKDGAEMASQLAQFNSLEQMMNINSSLNRLESKTAEGQSVHYPNYLGKEVLLKDGRLRVQNGEVLNGSFDIETRASQTVLEVRNETGQVVASKEQGPKEPGQHAVEWDARNNKGETLPDGLYTFSLKGKDQNSKETVIPVASRATITGIDLNDKESPFFTSLGKASFQSIAQIGDRNFKSKPPASPETSPLPKGQEALSGESPHEPWSPAPTASQDMKNPGSGFQETPKTLNEAETSPVFIPEINAPFNGDFLPAPEPSPDKPEAAVLPQSQGISGQKMVRK